MITGRRARRRPLIRSGAMAAVIVRSLSTMDSAVKHNHEQENAAQNGESTYPRGSASGQGYTMPLSESAAPAQPEITKYLRQLSALHAAGVLTDAEFSLAKGRLFGS